jgi:hypothetical protein
MAKLQTMKPLLYGIIGLIIVILASVAIWYHTMFKNLKTEGFSGVVSLTPSNGNECPTSAQRKQDGKIHVEPQGRSFDTMADYVAWFSSVIAAGELCIPPYVKGPREVDVVQASTAPSTGDREVGVSPEQVEKQNTFGNVFTKQVEGEQTYAKTDINKMDDYEYTRIFQNESSPRGELSRTAVNSLMAKNQFDWSILPFNSQARADKETEFISGRKDNAFRDPKTGVFFKNIEGMTVMPPDVDTSEAKEKAGLEGFTSEKPENLLMNHDLDEVAQMVKKMYENDPNWEPVVERIGENEYRVSELRPKPRKERYADASGDDESTIERAKEGGKITPSVVVEGGADPYFDKQGVLDYSNDRFHEYKDFKQWTPGLERMFAPTLDTTNWL